MDSKEAPMATISVITNVGVVTNIDLITNVGVVGKCLYCHGGYGFADMECAQDVLADCRLNRKVVFKTGVIKEKVVLVLSQIKLIHFISELVQT